MKRYFVVTVDDDATREQRDSFTNYLREKHPECGFWHHVSNSWLITDPNGIVTAAAIRARLQELMPGVTQLVLQVLPTEKWAGFGKPKSHEWMQRHWKAKI